MHRMYRWQRVLLLVVLALICICFKLISFPNMTKWDWTRKSPTTTSVSVNNAQPHIMYVVGDDLGWNDIGYHGSFVQTPTIDQLASEGVKMEKFYVQPICTPSRACLMSGRHLIHTGLQHNIIELKQPNALTLNATLLPEALRHHGYKNYMVGKWHLGFYNEKYVPENRGFNKFCGILTGSCDHYTRIMEETYTLVENSTKVLGNTTYSTHFYVQKTIEYVEQHLKDHPEKPMFLYVSFQAPHAPNQVPNIYSDLYRDHNITEIRKIHAGMVTAMDEGIKNITDFFKLRGIWDNTVLFFSTDNGGITLHGGDNTPLRDGKGTLYEGGIRGVAFARGKKIKPGSVTNELMHVTDIYPTIIHLAQNKEQSERISDHHSKSLDGFNVWDVLTGKNKSPREEVLVNIDPLMGNYGTSEFPDIYNTQVRSAVIKGKWKLITGYPGHRKHKPKPFKLEGSSVQLYDLEADPYETHNLASNKPNVVRELLERLQYYNSTAVPPYYPEDHAEGFGPNGVALPWIADPEVWV